MNHLRIHAINDLHFGKHQGANFTDLDHDFVVFYGLNESGKSTIAEYLTWTLGGPWRTAKDGSERPSPMITFLVASSAPLMKKNSTLMQSSKS
jgi:hypothetical protein